jgi:WD40 repeat protein
VTRRPTARLLAGTALFLAPLLSAQEAVIQPGRIRSIIAVRFSPEDSQIIFFSVAPDHRLCLWDVRSGRIRRLDVGCSGFDALAFSPDGKTLAAGGENQNVLLFDAASGAKLRQLIEEDSYGTRSGRYADYGTEKTIRFDKRDLPKSGHEEQPNPAARRLY